MAGAYDVVIAAGVESMTRVPMGSSFLPGQPAVRPEGHGALRPRAPGDLGRADRRRSGASPARRTTRSRCSRTTAPHAAHARRVASTREIVPVEVTVDGETPHLLAQDEGIRPDSSVEKLAQLKPAFTPDTGVITAGNSSQITDGAAAVLVMSEDTASALGLTPRARFHAFALAGADPVMMLTAPIPATAKVLERAGLTLDDIDLVEINEAFAPVVLAWQQRAPAPTWRRST